jgi:prepilin-type N-terminal cleavage/methylation domain-containing protein
VPLKTIRNQKGMSLIEVLVAAGLMAIVALGMTGVVTSMNKEQNNQTRTATFRELKTRFQNLITDQNAWSKTIQQNGDAGESMECILKHTSCTVNSIFDLTLYEPSGTPFFVPPAYGSVPTSAPGFTDKGVPCTGFNGTSGSGNDACPISYKVVWEPVCEAPCKNPLVRVTVRLLYNPSSSAQVAAVPLATGAIQNNEAAAAKYDVVMKRSSTTVNRSFSISIKRTSAGGAVGGGPCPNAWTVRGNSTMAPIGEYPGWSEDSDDFSLVTVDSSTGNVNIQPGTYNCKITATAWAVDSFQIQVRNTTDSVLLPDSAATANASTTGYAQAIATSNTIISISAAKNFVLEQRCQNPNFVLSPGRKFGMGLTANPYSEASTFVTFACTQTN